MSDHQLPEDLSQWPRDPFRLLGVMPGVGPRDLKRAYIRLIRTFKPEQFPEHFRRIREAYEIVLRHVEIFGDTDVPTQPPRSEPANPPLSPPPEKDTDESVVVPILRHGILGEDPPPEPIHHPLGTLGRAPTQPANEPYALWQLAVNGDAAGAYRRLRELDDSHPGRSEVCLPLYWLLVLHPELDPQRAPCDWLVHGLLANRCTGPLRELYRREIADDPAEGTGARCGRLLALELTAPAVADLLEWRWQAAGRLGHWWIITEDLERLRSRVARDDEEIWARLLLAAVEQLTAMQDPKAGLAIRKTLDEVKQFEHLQSRLAGALDRHEFLLEVSRGLRVLRKEAGIPPAFLELVPLSWTRPFGEVRPRLLQLLGELLRQPWTMLRLFDRIQAQSAAVLGQFGNLLSMLQGTVLDAADERSANDLADAIRQFLASKDWDTYGSFRGELLGFCLRDMIAPDLVSQAVLGHGDANLAQRIREDWPVKYVWLAYRVFWA
jgi:hypothetical protein